MTLVAGIYARRPDIRLPRSMCSSLEQAMSRDPSDRVRTYQQERIFVAKVDLGIYGHPAFATFPDGVATLTGRPLLKAADGQAVPSNRTDDLDRIRRAFRQQRWEILERACGVFSVVYYSKNTETLNLATDKVAVRPMYWWEGEDYVVFGSALRILEQLDFVPKTMDLRAITEQAVLETPLGHRTPYADISVMRPGERLSFINQERVDHTYWRWDQLTPNAAKGEELRREAYARFSTAVRRRLASENSASAFLSGGLDSRVVVAELTRQEVDVHTFNFSLPGEQDQLFGQLFARAIGSDHHEFPRSAGQDRWSFMMATALESAGCLQGASGHPETSSLVWSGDGGSGILGHICLRPETVDHMRSGNPEKAVRSFLEYRQAALPTGIFRSEYTRLADLPAQGILEELMELNARDPGRSFHLQLIQSRQRRNLYQHFEQIDLHRLEFHLPFFDGDFLELILAQPVTEFLNHSFFHRWLKCFPEAVASVPWQTYPDHEPCPIPAPYDAEWQWDNRELSRKQVFAKGRRLLSMEAFPAEIISRFRLALGLLADRIGLGDYAYLVNTAEHFCRYWQQTAGSTTCTPLRPPRGANYSNADAA